LPAAAAAALRLAAAAPAGIHSMNSHT
jgi:hypothetical protein